MGGERVVSRGTATVVFTDLVGSTQLRSRLGEDAADDLRRRHDEVLSAVTARLSGTVVKSMGDGLMATFGSAADGLEAAVGFHQAVAQLADEIDPEIALRVGVSVGDVAWEDGDCFGLPVVEAARLESAAASGQILCSAVVKLMSGGRAGVEFEAVGELELKGLDAPVEAFAVGWEPLPAAVVAPRDPFAGRVESLATIAAAVEATVGGAGRTVLVAGEPGAGKTRLVDEALRSADGVDVVWGHSYGGEVIPLGPVIEMLALLAERDLDRLRRCAGHHDRVIAELVPRAAGAWRDVVVPDPLDLIGARLDQTMVDDMLAASGGNPLFLTEIARQLAESGAFARGYDGVWRRVEEVQLELPRGLRQVIGGRVSRLDDRTQQLLATACMFDTPFDLALVAELADVGIDAAVESIEAAIGARLVEATNEFDVYRFAHAMVRQTLYDEANPSRIVRAHRRIAEALAARADADADYVHAAVIAHHYGRSSVMPGARDGVRWAVDAAFGAQRRAAYTDAVRNIEIAAELSDDPSLIPHDLRVAKAEVLAALGDVERSTAACRAVADELEPSQAVAMYAKAALTLEGAGAPIHDVWELAAEGLPYCGDDRGESWIQLKRFDLERREFTDPDYIGVPIDSADKQEVVAACVRLGVLIPGYGLIHRDRDQILAHPHPSPWALAMHAGELRRSLPAFDAMVTSARRNGQVGSELVVRGVFARVLHALGDLDRYNETIDGGIDLYTDAPWTNPALQFGAALQWGPRLAFYSVDRDGTMPVPHPALAGITTNGEFADAHDLAFRAQSADPSMAFLVGPLRAAFAFEFAQWGERERAIETLDSLMPSVIATHPGMLNGPGFAAIAIAASIELDDFRWADELREAAQRVVEVGFHYPDSPFDVRAQMGRMEARLGRPDDARRWFDAARRARLDQGALPYLALVNLWDAEAELRLDGPSGRIRELLDASRPELERIGSDRRVAECDEIEQAL